MRAEAISESEVPTGARAYVNDAVILHHVRFALTARGDRFWCASYGCIPPVISNCTRKIRQSQAPARPGPRDRRRHLRVRPALVRGGWIGDAQLTRPLVLGHEIGGVARWAARRYTRGSGPGDSMRTVPAMPGRPATSARRSASPVMVRRMVVCERSWRGPPSSCTPADDPLAPP